MFKKESVKRCVNMLLYELIITDNVDNFSQRVVQKYIGALNFREQLRSCISPCGSFIFSGSEDNLAYAWNTDTGNIPVNNNTLINK